MTMTLAPQLTESRVDAFLRVKRINELIRERQLAEIELDPWGSVADLEYNRMLDLTFGSVSYIYRLPRDGFGVSLGQVNRNGDLDTIFLHGFCILFAIAAHARTGLPFRIFTHKNSTPDWWQGHVGLDLGDGHYLDITGRGLISVKEMGDLYTGETIELAELVERHVDEPYRADPLTFLDELERLFTEQAAYEVLDAYGLLPR